VIVALASLSHCFADFTGKDCLFAHYLQLLIAASIFWLLDFANFDLSLSSISHQSPNSLNLYPPPHLRINKSRIAAVG
jgi:hypothetical protein